MRKISITGVLVGATADIAGTHILQALLAFCVLIHPEIRHAPHDQIPELIITTMRTSPLFLTLHFLVGNGCSILGGFVSAKIAKRSELINGALASFICFSLGLFLIFSGKSKTAPLTQIAHQFVCPLLGMFGGYLCLRFKKHPVAPSSQ